MASNTQYTVMESVITDGYISDEDVIVKDSEVRRSSGEMWNNILANKERLQSLALNFNTTSY